MEIKLRTSKKTKNIDVDNSIISIDTSDETLIENFVLDYDVLVIDYSNRYFIGDTVLNEITSYTKYPELTIVTDILKCFDLDNSFLDRKISKLSTTEIIYLNIIRNISKIDKIVLFKDLFLGLDLSSQKKIIKLLNYLKGHSYYIFVCSSDIDKLYKLVDNSIIACKTAIKYGTVNEIYSDIDTLVKYKLDIPTLSYITYKAKEDKNVKLFYSRDVRDIIKDIYKHV